MASKSKNAFWNCCETAPKTSKALQCLAVSQGPFNTIFPYLASYITLSCSSWSADGLSRDDRAVRLVAISYILPTFHFHPHVPRYLTASARLLTSSLMRATGLCSAAEWAVPYLPHPWDKWQGLTGSTSVGRAVVTVVARDLIG